MASQIGIFNMALIFMGARPLLSLDEDTKSKRTLVALWDATRDEVLRDHPWNFAAKRVSLAELTTSPVFGFAHAFSLPADYIRLQEVGEPGDNIVYAIEGDTLVTDESVVYLKYTSRVTDVAKFDAKFAVALALKLSAYAAYAITASTGMVRAMNAAYDAALVGAMGADGQEGSPKEIRDNALIEARA